MLDLRVPSLLVAAEQGNRQAERSHLRTSLADHMGRHTCLIMTERQGSCGLQRGEMKENARSRSRT